MSRQTPPDPLADLRQEDVANVSTQRPATAASEAQAAPVAPEAPLAPEAPTEAITDTAWHQEAASTIVARWHDDMVAKAQMHGGGTCGCRYAAAMALVVLYGPPVPTPEVTPEDPDAGVQP